MRIMVLGATGFIGSNLVECYRELGHKVIECSSADGNLTDWRVAEGLVSRAGDAVIFAAGNKDVLNCQSHYANAFAINAFAPGYVARACRETGVRFVYMSTDHVFDGRKGRYRAYTQPNPVSIYGMSKACGEKIAVMENPAALIVRTGAVYGPRSPLFAWLARELFQQKPVDAYIDVIATPTYVVDLAAMLLRAIERGDTGVLHMAGLERMSRLAWFTAFAITFGHDASLLRRAEASVGRLTKCLLPDVSLEIDTQALQYVPRPVEAAMAHWKEHYA